MNKIIDANSDLSIQVHPDDAYAYKNENKSNEWDYTKNILDEFN